MNIRGFCVTCGALTTIFVTTYGAYICEKCGYEMHHHEPVRTMTSTATTVRNDIIGTSTSTSTSSTTSSSTSSSSTTTSI